MTTDEKSIDVIATADTLSNDFESITHVIPLHYFPSSRLALSSALSHFSSGTSDRKTLCKKGHLVLFSLRFKIAFVV